jgi:long-chain acyl-CoA synthetase
MQEFSVPVAYVVQPDYNITVDVFKNASGWPDAVGLKRRTHGSWMPVTWRDFAAEVRASATGLGLEPTTGRS